MAAAATPSVIGFKPVAWAGQAANISITGLPTANVTYYFDGPMPGVPLAAPPEWDRNGTAILSVFVGNATNETATMKPFTVDMGEAGNYTFNVTVMPQVEAPKFAEDPAWLEMFESASGSAAPAGWNATGWTFDTIKGIWMAHGITAGKHRFTRGSGVVAAAIGEGPHTLVSPPVTLDGQGNYELRFASHYNVSGGTEEQRARVSVSYGDGGNATELAVLDKTDESNMIRARLTPPSNTSVATFTFTLEGGNNVSFWMIDDVEVVHPLSADISGDPIETIDIISDIQGIQQNAWMHDSLLPGLRKLKKASTLVINGDLVDHDAPETWASFTSALNSTKPWEYYDDVISVAGNHEMFYNTPDSATHINNFLNATQMTVRYGANGRGLWGEHVTKAGTPLIWFASEYFDFMPTIGFPPYVEISDAQFLFVAQRLAHWREQNRAVILFSHHPLPYSVSSTWSNFENRTYGDDELRVRYLLASNPHAVFITSHTHYDIAANDQNANHRPIAGYNNTIKTFNTGATLNYVGVGADPWLSEKLGDGSPTGLQAEVYSDRIRIKAYRFWNLSTDATLIQTRDVGVPLGGPKATPQPTGKDSSAARIGLAGALVVASLLGSLVLSCL